MTRIAWSKSADLKIREIIDMRLPTNECWTRLAIAFPRRSYRAIKTHVAALGIKIDEPDFPRWSKTEVIRLIRFFHEGYTVGQMAKYLRRPILDVMKRGSRIRISLSHGKTNDIRLKDGQQDDDAEHLQWLADIERKKREREQMRLNLFLPIHARTRAVK